jgi:ABC-type phosphate transport system substrate-binding protein
MFLRGRFLKWHIVFIVIVIFITLRVSPVFAVNFEVIANKGVLDSTLLKAELKAIYLGEKVKWGNRKHIRVAILEDALVYKGFLQTVVGKTPAQFDQHWSRMVMTGKASMPQIFTDVQQLVNYVANEPNAVGVVPAGLPYNSVKKMIYIDGEKE